MKTLRAFIRESLVVEAVGLKQFGRDVSFTPDIQKTSESELSNSVLGGIKTAITSGPGVLGKLGASGFGTVAKAGQAVATTAWRSPIVKIGVLALGLGGALAGRSAGQDVTDEDAKKAQDLITAFSKEVSDLLKDPRTKSDLEKSLRTPSILNRPTASTASNLADEFQTNYSSVATRFKRSSTYKDLFLNLPMPNSSDAFDDLKKHIDEKISSKISNASNKVEAQQALEILAHKIVVVALVDGGIILGAMDQDIKEIDKIIPSDDYNMRSSVERSLNAASNASWDAIISNDFYKRASADARGEGQ